MSSDPSITNNTQTDQVSPQAGDRPWLRHYAEGVPTALTIPDRPLTWLLDQAVQRFPSQTAIIYYGSRISYARLSSLANRFAIALHRLGVRKGDRVAISLPNIPQYPIVYYGALRAGAVVVPTNPLYTEREMQHQLADSGAKMLVMLDTFYPVVVRNIRSQTALEQVIVTSPADFLPPLLRMLYPIKQRREKNAHPPLAREEFTRDTTLHTLSSLLTPQNSGDVEVFNLPVPTEPDDLAALQYTGGTTGISKGAMLTHRNLLANAYQTRYWVPSLVEGQEKMLCALPFFHSYGMTVCMNFSILAGATMLLLPRFKAKEALKVVRRYQPRLFPGIPTMYIALLREAGQHPEHLHSIRYCISGAMALPAQVQNDFESITGGKLVEGYGLSEASPVTHSNPLSEKCRNGSIGVPLPEVDAAIMHPESDELLPPGEPGELVVRGPNIMKGYWQREDENQKTFVNGWMRTGDIGKTDEDNYFYIVERAKDLIITGGFNVYPREVEEVLYQHPAVAEACALGLPDSYRGEAVSAFVALKPDIEATEQKKQEILEHCRQNLAGYKVPRLLEFRESLPKSIIGKILRRELRAEALASGLAAKPKS